MMRFILPLLLSFLFGLFSPAASFAEGNRSVTILYTGSVMGNSDPCATWGNNSSGGLARRASMIESIRKEKKSVLLLDCGEVFGPQIDHANAELHLKAMERMGYDALSLGSRELSFGKEFLERSRSQVSFPYIASNLLYGGISLPWTREYVIKEVGGVKVAILGILDPDDFKKIPNRDDLKGFEIIPPEAALDRWLPEVRGKADLVILLSQLDATRNQALMDAARRIDVVVSSGLSDILYVNPPRNAGFVLHTGERGMTLGRATITFDDQRRHSMSDTRDVSLDRSVPDNGEIRELIETYKKEQEIKKEKMKKELTEGLKLTPEEFMERYRKRQAEPKKEK